MLANEARNRAGVAAIGSLGGGSITSIFGFMLTPALRSKRSVKLLVIAGTLLYGLGLGTAAASTRYWHLLLTQGVIAGVGNGLVQYPLATIAPEYFSGRSGKAMGLITAASGLGGLTYAPIIRMMLKNLGTRKTLGLLSLINLSTCGTIAYFAQPPRKVKARCATVPWKFAKEPVFILTIFVNLLSTLAINIPMALGPDFSRALGYSAGIGALLLAVNNGIGSPSRIAIGHIADKIGHQNTLFVAMAIITLTTWILWLVGAMIGTKCMWLTFIIIHGLLGGAFSTLCGNVTVQLFGHEMYFASAGIFSCARGVGYLAGVPIAGAILGDVKDRDAIPQDFGGMIVYVGSLLLICTACILAVRILDGRKKGWKLIA
ncbi:MFS general substrate transporter [Glonium stellatum]|uniref:MFS general substrate transporter n=1 Tax=Glonium stellatum TaxID=574774 RepID=A0A8E2F2A0_9PEZI|nr:MFS general substrate transporter [Glonium stellatum]